MLYSLIISFSHLLNISKLSQVTNLSKAVTGLSVKSHIDNHDEKIHETKNVKLDMGDDGKNSFTNKLCM